MKIHMGLTVIALLIIGQSLAFREPKCSKFDYEEKLLAKMIRMEIEMEQIKRKIETNIEPRIENLTLTVFPPAPIVAFSAYNTAKTEYSADEIIVFKSVFFNDGSHYDTLTGVFKAQIEGLYYFTLHVCNKPGQFVHFAIVHNDIRAALSAQYEDAGTSCGSVSSLLNVNVGDNVYVVSTYSTTLFENQHRRASFMGFLVRK